MKSGTVCTSSAPRSFFRVSSGTQPAKRRDLVGRYKGSTRGLICGSISSRIKSLICNTTEIYDNAILMGGHYVLCFYLSAHRGRACYDTRAQCRCSLFAISHVVPLPFVLQKGIEWHLNAVSKFFFCPNMQLGHDAWADTAGVGWFLLLVSK